MTEPKDRKSTAGSEETEKKRFRVGDVVRSISGRDRKRVFIVVAYDKDNKKSPVVIADGTLRTLADGKHKNPMHLVSVGVLGGSDISELENHPTDSRISELCRRYDEAESIF